MNLYDFHRFATSPVPDDPDCAGSEVLSLSPGTRSDIVEWLKYQYISTTYTSTAESRLTALVDANRDGRPGAKRIAILTGSNGVGKSTFALEWAREMYRQELSGQGPLVPATVPTYAPESGMRSICTPIVWLNVDGNMGKPELDAAICAFFGLSTDGTADKKALRARHGLRQHRVRVVVIDDAHFLNTREKRGRELLNHLKALNTELGDRGATMVIVGANLRGGSILADPQISCRSITIELPSSDGVPVDDAARAQTQRSLADIECHLRARIPGIGQRQLTNTLAQRIAERVGGRHGDIIKLVCDATALFIKDTAATGLTVSHINSAEVTDRAASLEVSYTQNRRARTRVPR